jgi:hypothetical protein
MSVVIVIVMKSRGNTSFGFIGRCVTPTVGTTFPMRRFGKVRERLCKLHRTTLKPERRELEKIEVSN